MKRFCCWVVVVAVAMQSILLIGSASATGDINMSVSPMRESVVLNPGDMYKSSYKVSNPGFSEQDLYYHVEVKPFYVNENYDPVFDEQVGNDKQLMKDWIKITSGESGTVAPNEIVTVEYEIKVPENAPAGGQYACLSTVTDVEPSKDGTINIGEGMSINHVILAEITGDTVMAGEILDVDVQSFLLGGMINATATVRNDGNVHGLATYTMKVYPLFSDTPSYSNEEDPETHYVLPERTYRNESYWEETPMMGIFNVVYTVDFQGLQSEVTRMVIICPWWMIFIVVLGIVVLVIRAISLIKLKRLAKIVENR